MAHLIRDPGGRSETRFGLVPGENLLGRAPGNHIVVDHPSLSRQHARLTVVAPATGPVQITLTDLGSRNGTFRGDEPISTVILADGDRFRCGDIPFVVVTRPEAGPGIREERVMRAEAPFQTLLTASPRERSALRVAASPAERSEAKLRILLGISRLLSSPEPPGAVMEKVFDLLFQVLDVDRASLLLLEDGTLRPRLTRSALGAEEGAIHSRSIAEHVLSREVGVLAVDATSDPRFQAAQSVLGSQIRSSMCVPVRAGERVMGVLYVDHLSLAGRYTAEDLDFLGAFATQAGIALENARLVRTLEDEAARRTSLQRFFPPTVLRALSDTPGLGAAPRDHDVTVLFSDITGFTAFSSALPPRAVVGLLNRYFPLMAEIVFRHEGTLEKYIGDALMAIWGAPVAHDDDADRALQAAREMLDVLDTFDPALPGLDRLRVHVGLNSGPIAFGNIGSPDYVQFAAIGDTTNVASRVCTQAGSGEILLSEATRARLRREVPLDTLPPVAVKGKAEPLVLHRVRRGPDRHEQA